MDIVVNAASFAGWRERRGGHGNISYGEKIYDVLSIHEHDLATFGGIEPFAKPIPRGFGDFSPGDNKCVIDQHATTDFWIEDLVPKHHRHLIKYLADICCSALAHASGIKLVAFGLQAEI